MAVCISRLEISFNILCANNTYKQVEINDTFTKKAVVKLNILGGGILAVASWVLGLPWQCSFEFFI